MPRGRELAGVSCRALGRSKISQPLCGLPVNVRVLLKQGGSVLKRYLKVCPASRWCDSSPTELYSERRLTRQDDKLFGWNNQIMCSQ
jgi:hypothetical protein